MAGLALNAGASILLRAQYFGSEPLITAKLNLSARLGIGVYMYPHDPLPWERHSDPDCHA